MNAGRIPAPRIVVPWTRKERWAIGSLAVVTMILSGYGMMADVPGTRLGIERLHIQLALKYGMGDLNPHFFIHPPLMSYLLFGLYGIAFLVGKTVGSLRSIAEFEQLYFTDPTLFYLIGRSAMLVVATWSVILFARIGRPHCPNCGREIARQSKEQIR